MRESEGFYFNVFVVIPLQLNLHFSLTHSHLRSKSRSLSEWVVFNFLSLSQLPLFSPSLFLQFWRRINLLWFYVLRIQCFWFRLNFSLLYCVCELRSFSSCLPSVLPCYFLFFRYLDRIVLVLLSWNFFNWTWSICSYCCIVLLILFVCIVFNYNIEN